METTQNSWQRAECRQQEKRKGRRMNRRIFVSFCLLLTVFLLTVSPIEAQQAEKVYRIGYLSRRWTNAQAGQLAAFKQGMRELGFGEGENYVIEYRNGKGDKDRLREVAAELVRRHVSRVAIGRVLYEVEAHDICFRAEPPYERKDLSRVQSAGLGRSGARSKTGVDGVDVE